MTPDTVDITVVGSDPYDHIDDVLIADLNGDGDDDLVVTAGGAGPDDARPGAGEVHVLFGPLDAGTGVDLLRGPLAAGTVVDLRTSDADLTVFGTDGRTPDHFGDRFGAMLATGDLTGDGVADVIVGAPLAAGPGNGRRTAGQVYVVSGVQVPGPNRPPTADPGGPYEVPPCDGDIGIWLDGSGSFDRDAGAPGLCGVVVAPERRRSGVGYLTYETISPHPARSRTGHPVGLRQQPRPDPRRRGGARAGAGVSGGRCRGGARQPVAGRRPGDARVDGRLLSAPDRRAGPGERAPRRQARAPRQRRPERAGAAGAPLLLGVVRPARQSSRRAWLAVLRRSDRGPGSVREDRAFVRPELRFESEQEQLVGAVRKGKPDDQLDIGLLFDVKLCQRYVYRSSRAVDRRGTEPKR